MSKHSKDLTRIPVKWIRDFAKAAYKKGPECEICGTTEKLEFHHYYSVTPLFEKWCRENKIVIKTDEDVLAIRERFVEENYDEIYVHTTTLCKAHHTDGLHKVYGKSPLLSTAKKQMNWVRIQKEKHEARKLAS
jgi:hypothetical protein